MRAIVRYMGQLVEHGSLILGADVGKELGTHLVQSHGWDPRDWPLWACFVMVLLALAIGALCYRIISRWRSWFSEREHQRAATAFAAEKAATIEKHSRYAVMAVAGVALATALISLLGKGQQSSQSGAV